jgi:hypothetical protein
VAHPIWALSVGHGLLVGTDGEAMRLLALGSAAAVLLGIAVHLLARPRGAAVSPPHAGAPSGLRAGSLR